MTIKSRTHKGEGFNELRFEDELGHEEVFIHAQKDQNTVVKNNQTQSIGADRSSQVGQDETITVGRTRMRVVKANDTVKVGGNKNDTVAGKYEIEVGGTLRLKCGKTLIELHANGKLNITCSRHPPMPKTYIAQGSDKVHINSRPSARSGDKATCDATIDVYANVSPNVRIGGGTVTVRNIHNGKSKTAQIVGIVAALLISKRMGGSPSSVFRNEN